MLIQSALIVDDSQMARTVLKKQLESKYISVQMVDSGEQAIEYLQANNPDVVFMDCLMPGMDGYETTKVIKNNPQTATSVIVMCTGKESDEDKQKAKDIGASDYMCKSSSPEPLQAVLNNLKNISKQSKTLDLAYLNDVYVQINSLDKVLSERLTNYDFSFLINKIADLSGKISEDVAIKIAEKTAKHVANDTALQVANDVSNNVSLAGLSSFSEEFSGDTNKKMHILAKQVEEKIIFAVKTALGDIHEYIDTRLTQIDEKLLPELRNEMLDSFQSKIDELKLQINRLENNNYYEQLIEQKTHETLEKNLSIYATTILEHPFAHDLIEQKVQKNLLKYNDTFEVLDKIKTTYSHAKFYSIIALVFSASAVIVSIYSLFKS